MNDRLENIKRAAESLRQLIDETAGYAPYSSQLFDTLERLGKKGAGITLMIKEEIDAAIDNDENTISRECELSHIQELRNQYYQSQL